MNYNETILEVKKLINSKEYEKAKEILLTMIDSANIKEVEDEKNTHYSFNNYIEALLFDNIYRTGKKNIGPNINYSQVYYYLGFINVDMKDYDKALEYHNKGLMWNPIYVPIMFEIAAIYRNIGKIEKFREQIEKTYSYIYDSLYMAKYYRELGWYYAEKKVFDLANALYTKSLQYLDTKIARQELLFIAQQENRELKFSSREEIEKMFKNYNIKNDFADNVVHIIYEEYQKISKMQSHPELVRYLSQRLYDITLNKVFMTYYEIKNEQYGVKIMVPDTWKYLEKNYYEKYNVAPNTAFYLITAQNQLVNITCDGRCTDEELEKAFNLNIENMKKLGYEIEEEYYTTGEIKNRKAFVKVEQNGKKIRFFQVYMVVNGYLFCIAWQVNSEEKDLIKLLTSACNSFAMQVANSLTAIDNGQIKITEKI